METVSDGFKANIVPWAKCLSSVSVGILSCLLNLSRMDSGCSWLAGCWTLPDKERKEQPCWALLPSDAIIEAEGNAR